MKQADYFDYTVLKKYVLSLMPPQPINYSVAKERQDKEIDMLKETLGGRRFFFVTNLENFEIEQSHGIRKWLGYSENDFTMKTYLDIVHPGRKKSLIMVAMKLYDSLCKGNYTLNFMVQRYSSLVILKHYNGHYLEVNKISSVFQYDKKNRLTAYLNEFTIISHDDRQPLDPFFFTQHGHAEERGEEILQQTMEFFLQMKVFSERELQIARILAYHPTTTKSQMAATFNISVHTVSEYYERFLNKAREFFHQPFANATEAALYIKKEKLLL